MVLLQKSQHTDFKQLFDVRNWLRMVRNQDFFCSGWLSAFVRQPLSEEVIGFIGLSYKVTVIPGDLLIQSDRASHIN